MNIQLFNDPWPYGIIEHTYSADQFDRSLIEIEDKFRQTVTDGYPVVAHDLAETYPETYKLIEELDLYQLFLKVKDHFKVRDYKKLRATAQIAGSRMYPHDVHYESKTKIFSLVTYVSPVEGRGTFLYDINKRFSKELEWKPNRSMFFCGETDVTWHSYFSENQPRITINRFLQG